MEKARWGVVTTAREPLQLLIAFVAHHLSVGASEVHIFLDTPDKSKARKLAAIKGCFVTECSPAYWKQVAGRRHVRSLNMRQIKNAESVYKTTDLDWLLHMDADEFVMPSSDIGQALAASDPELVYREIPNVERVYLGPDTPQTIFDGSFVIPMKHDAETRLRLYGERQSYLMDGVLGHQSGKSLVRVGEEVVIGIHSPRKNKKFTRTRYLNSKPLEGTRILHFDGLTPQHWISKLQRYVATYRPEELPTLGDARLAQIEHIVAAGGDEKALVGLHHLLRHLSPEAEAALREAGQLIDIPFDPTPAIAALGIGAVDLSVTAFDEALSAMNA